MSIDATENYISDVNVQQRVVKQIRDTVVKLEKKFSVASDWSFCTFI